MVDHATHTRHARILYLEDSETDSILVTRELRKAGVDGEIVRVDNKTAFLQRLDENGWDLILSDYALPQFNGLEALEIVKRRREEKRIDQTIPFVVISGRIGEEVAVEVMRSGADDYIMKDNIKRLGPVVNRELDERAVRLQERAAKQQLRRSEDRYQTLIDLLPHGVIKLTPAGVITFVNRACAAMTGYSTAEMVGRHALRFADPESAERLRLTLGSLDTNPDHNRGIEVQIVRNDGNRVYIQLAWRFRYDGDGTPASVVGVMTDVTQQKEAEEALRRSEQRYRAIVEDQTELICRYNADFLFTYVNPAACRAFGTAEEEIIGRSLFDFEDPENYRHIARHLSALQPEAPVTELENRNRLPDGDYAWQRWTVRGIFSHDGRLLEYQAVGRDVTTQKRMQLELERSEAKFYKIFQDSPEPIVISTLDGRFVDVNDTFIQSFGFSRAEIADKSSLELGIWYDASERDRIIGEYQEHGHVSNSEHRMVTKSGEMRTYLWSLDEIVLENEEYLLWLGRDMTETRRLEEQMRTRRRLESIGTLAGGIAHDFNNILAVIFGYGEMAKSKAAFDAALLRYTEEILKAAGRAKGLVKQVLTFSRQAETERQPVEVRLIIKETLRLMTAALPATIELKTDLTSRAQVNADPTQLHQVFMNLFTNAYHAMRDTGGTLSTTTRDIELSPGNSYGLDPGPYMRIDVVDTGHGIEPEVAERIFEPYFTTKGVEEGTGLGLSVVHGIVTGVGGAIDVNSTPGKGTRMRLFLPTIVAAKASVESPEEESAAAIAAARILFVDDEEEIATMISESLTLRGYEIDAFVDAERALEAFRKDPEGYDVVVTDQTMPNLTGLQLGRAILEIRADTPIIICTGYSDQMNEDIAAREGFASFLMKPLQERELMGAIESALE
ncbi:MAG: PAS domain S-box protein [Spirochaetota bacterium]